MWQERLDSYVEAKRRHDQAERVMERAERLMCKLSKRVDIDRAYHLAGVGLADERSVRACQQMIRARNALRDALDGLPLPTRIRALGAALCADLPALANDR